MAATTADVKRDIELTRERMSTTLDQLENKLNVVQVIKDHPWPAIALAVGAGFALSGSRADVKAAAATVAATQGAGSKVGDMLDDLVASLMAGVTSAFHQRADSFIDQIRTGLGGPSAAGGAGSTGARRPLPRSNQTVDPEQFRGAPLQGGADRGVTEAGWAPQGLGSEGYRAD